MATTWCYFPYQKEVYYRYALENSTISMTFGVDLDLAPLDRETIKLEYMAFAPQLSANQINANYSILYHFAHSVSIGDRVIFPSTVFDRMINVGECTGAYRYVAGHPLRCVHQRPVKWLETFPRDAFSAQAIQGISITLALFRVHNEIFLCELDALLG